MASKKITELTENTTPISTDIVVMVDDPSGTPVTQKATLGNLRSAVGGVTSGQATVDFGANTQEDSKATVTVSTAAALTASIILVSPSGVATTNHDPDDYQWDNIYGYVTNIVNGVSFDIVGVAPNGSFGQYKFNYLIQ